MKAKKRGRRFFAVLLTLAMLLSAVPLTGLTAFAAEATSGDFEYEVLSETDKTCEITDYTGSATELTIPSELDGYTVTSIGYEAFRGCDSLTSIVIPGSVTSIGNRAFDNCDSLTSIDIPNSVASIGKNAFSFCHGLTSITLPDSVTSIGDSAFAYCGSLTSITIPDSVTSIGEYAFSSCYSLKSINVANGNSHYASVDGVLFNKEKTELLLCPEGKAGTYAVPDSVTSIGDSAFAYCDALTGITFPDSVTSIGYRAFISCDSLTSVTLGNSVTSIGEGAFELCDALMSIAIPDSVTSIGGSAFWGCDSLTSVTIPDSVTSIEDYTFYNCESLTSVAIGNGVTSIGNSAFRYCDSLTNITIPDSVTSIGVRAFSDCDSLEYITIPDSVTSIGDYAFTGCDALTDVYYSGSQAEWESIEISYYNNYSFLNATIHYNSSAPVGLAFQDPYVFMQVGDTKQLTVCFNGEPANDTVDWYIVQGDSVTVNDSGLVTAVAEGKTVLFATSKDDANQIAACTIYVGTPNNAAYTMTYDTRQYYADGGFYSTVSSISDCVELYFLLENRIVDELAHSIAQEKYEQYFKDLSPVTLTATVNGDGLSFSRDSAQKTYTKTFESLSAGNATDDLLMLFPHDLTVPAAGKTYTVTITLESESFDAITEQYTFTLENLSSKSANEHMDFISSNRDYSVSKQNIYGNTMVTLKDDAEYNWSKYSTFNFENYHEIVLADVLVQMLNVNQVELPSLVPAVLKDWVNTYKTMLSGITTIVNDDYTGAFDLSETNIDKLLKKSKYTTDGIYVEDEMYQTVLDLLGNAGNAQKVSKLFAAMDKTQQVFGFVKLGVNILKDAVEWGNKISIFNAYSAADDEFKAVMQTFADFIPDSEAGMKEAVYDYINYSADISGQAGELLESFAGMFKDVTLEVFSSCIGQSLLKYIGAQTLNWIGGITLAGGAALSTTAAFAGVQTAFSAFFTGATLGLCLSDLLCKSSGLSEEMSKVVAMSEFSPYVIATLNLYETNLNLNRTDDAVNHFEYAFALHKATQSYIMEHTISALEIKRDSFIIKLFGKDDYDGLISDILAQKSGIDHLMCHAAADQSETVETHTKVIAIKCPVDVYVYDENGNEVVRIINDIPEYVAAGINVLVGDSEKFIAVSADKTYSVKIVATGAGTMEYIVTEYEAGAQRARTVRKTDIPLAVKKEFTGEIKEGMDIDAESYALSYDGDPLTPDSVVEIPVTGVMLNQKELTLLPREDTQLIATVMPANATNAAVHWYSEDSSVATVDENGVVTAVAAGTTTIFVATEDWGYTAVCTVTVENSATLGDVNADGKVDAVDARWVLQAAAGMRTLENATAADVNGDGKIDAVDARWILQAAAGLRTL